MRSKSQCSSSVPRFGASVHVSAKHVHFHVFEKNVKSNNALELKCSAGFKKTVGSFECPLGVQTWPSRLQTPRPQTQTAPDVSSNSCTSQLTCATSSVASSRGVFSGGVAGSSAGSGAKDEPRRHRASAMAVRVARRVGGRSTGGRE